MADPLEIEMIVNGVTTELAALPSTSLADALRETLGLTGTHLGCEHGACGACTVLVDGRSVRACLMFAFQAAGSQVETVEGLASAGVLHPVQEAFSEEHGLQCGFCTPGMLMSTLELLRENPDPDDEAIREALSGNICRCTGYRDIMRSVRAAAEKFRTSGGEVR